MDKSSSRGDRGVSEEWQANNPDSLSGAEKDKLRAEIAERGKNPMASLADFEKTKFSDFEALLAAFDSLEREGVKGIKTSREFQTFDMIRELIIKARNSIRKVLGRNSFVGAVDYEQIFTRNFGLREKVVKLLEDEKEKILKEK